jgi:hypothetical protein
MIRLLSEFFALQTNHLIQPPLIAEPKGRASRSVRKLMIDNPDLSREQAEEMIEKNPRPSKSIRKLMKKNPNLSIEEVEKMAKENRAKIKAEQKIQQDLDKEKKLANSKQTKQTKKRRQALRDEIMRKDPKLTQEEANELAILEMKK